MERVGIGVGEALPPPPLQPEEARGPRGEREAGTLRAAGPGPLAAGIFSSGLRTHKVTSAPQPSHQGPPAASYRWTAPLQALPQPFPQFQGLSSMGFP